MRPVSEALSLLRTPGFHRVTLVSGHAPRTIEFYRDLLGFELLPADNGHGLPAHALMFGIGGGRPGTLIAFLERPGAPRGRPGIGGVHHVALGVADESALLMWKRWLNQHRVATSGPINRGYFKSLYFSDPDGQILELATAGPGYAIDEPAEELGRRVIAHHEHLLQQTDDGSEYASRTHPEPIPAVMAPMAISGIHHVSAITSDTERADLFYSKHLGLTRIKKTVNQDDLRMPHHFWANYDGHRVAPHSSWTLFEYPARFHRSMEGVGQTHSVGLRASAEELDEWREQLLEAKVPVTPVVAAEGFKSIEFMDPDGIVLELVAGQQ